MHGETITLLLLIALGFGTWQGLNRPGITERYLFSAEALRLRRDWIRLISPAFLHANWVHFAGNALTLVFFGSELENRFGPLWLLTVFFLSVAGGHGLCLLLHRQGEYRALGASGGALGVLFSSLLLFPGMRIMLFPLPIPFPAWLYGLGFLFYTLSSLRGGGGVSHEAHLGGMMSGMVITLLKYPEAASQQPLLTAALLLLGSGGIWFFHQNPGRIPGFFNWKLKEWTRRRGAKREEQVDALLDKISREGLQSLSPRERRILSDASRERGGGR